MISRDKLVKTVKCVREILRAIFPEDDAHRSDWGSAFIGMGGGSTSLHIILHFKHMFIPLIYES